MIWGFWRIKQKQAECKRTSGPERWAPRRCGGGLIAKSCPTLATPWTVCSLPGSSVHGILQARILEWAAISFSRGIFPTQGLNPCLLNCRQILNQLSYEGKSPRSEVSHFIFLLFIGFAQKMRLCLRAAPWSSRLCSWDPTKVVMTEMNPKKHNRGSEKQTKM